MTQYNMTQHDTTRHSTTPHTTQHDKTQYNTTQHNTTQHNMIATIQHDDRNILGSNTLLCYSSLIYVTVVFPKLRHFSYPYLRISCLIYCFTFLRTLFDRAWPLSQLHYIAFSTNVTLTYLCMEFKLSQTFLLNSKLDSESSVELPCVQCK